MGLFGRIFKVAEAEAHSAIDKLEDPIKMTEQGIRDLKNDLNTALTSLAEVKASAIRLKKQGEDKKKLAADYERKAMLILQKMQKGEMEAGEAESLATEVLAKKEEMASQAAKLLADHKQQQAMADQLQAKIDKLKQTIQRYENELVTLKARAKTAESMKKINKQMAKVDSSGTISMLEKMKAKVDEEESLAEAYGEINDSGLDLDAKLENALDEPANAKAADSLVELKKKMGLE